jgi:hypothetical protein
VERSFAISLEPTTETIGRMHRKQIDRGQPVEWERFDLQRYLDAGQHELVERARREWAHRAVAEYMSTAQFSQLLHRLTRLGAPLELIGAATRLPVDECRHAELCAKMAELLGGAGERHQVSEPNLWLYNEEEQIDEGNERGLLLATTLTVLTACCFGETLSVPMLEAIEVVCTDEVAGRCAQLIAGDEGYHSTFGWEALGWLWPRLCEEDQALIRARLPRLMAHFEHVSAANPKILEQLAGGGVEIERGETNLGTLTHLQYAAIFYHTMEHEILPGLDALGMDGMGAWARRFG